MAKVCTAYSAINIHQRVGRYIVVPLQLSLDGLSIEKKDTEDIWKLDTETLKQRWSRPRRCASLTHHVSKE